mgnify:CR=1 FL=1
MPKLTVILASVREGRGGEAIAQWFVTRAKEHGKFDVQLADLKELKLPILERAASSAAQKYVHDSTKAWSAIVDASDAFVFVTPEYNYTLPPALVNALDTVYHEWTLQADRLRQLRRRVRRDAGGADGEADGDRLQDDADDRSGQHPLLLPADRRGRVQEQRTFMTRPLPSCSTSFCAGPTLSRSFDSSAIALDAESVRSGFWPVRSLPVVSAIVMTRSVRVIRSDQRVIAHTAKPRLRPPPRRPRE